MALRAPDVEVVAITTVAGNVPVEQSTRNALYVAEICGSDVPVYAGADKPFAASLSERDVVPWRGRVGRAWLPAAKEINGTLARGRCHHCGVRRASGADDRHAGAAHKPGPGPREEAVDCRGKSAAA